MTTWRFILAMLAALSLPPALHGADDRGALRSAEVQALLADRLARAETAAEPIKIILEDRLGRDLRPNIAAADGVTQYRFNGRHQVLVPANRAEALLNRMPAGVVARLSYPHTPLAVTSQGVGITGAQDMHDLSFDGAGIKVGVIDLGFTSFTSAQASGDLPAAMTITDYTGTGTGGTNHGTNVSEIVYDMAPGAELFLAKVSTDVELAQALNDMITAGVRVINHSVAWFGAAYYDGTGPICDVADDAETAGIQWVNAAGNQRTAHYAATFADADSDLRHEFTSGQNYNTMSVQGGVPTTLILNWDDYPDSLVDYDLFIFNGNPDAGGALVASSQNAQSGKGLFHFPWPFEALTYTPSSSGTHYIVIEKDKSNTPHLPLTLFSLGPNLSVRTLSSSIPQPADCVSVLAVGAVNLSDVAEGFSSEGPTTDGRNKPEISAPNRTVTSLSGSFAGTSGASPHAAGAAALLLAQNPALSTVALRAAMTSQVLDVSAAGFDFRTGFGRISLDADADGVIHDADNCVLVFNPPQTDTDADGAGDACDEDDDNDGLSDDFELSIGTDPLLADTDGDGLSDYDEVAFDGDATAFTPGADPDPLSPDTDEDGLGDATDPMPLTFNYADGDLAPLGAPDGVVNGADYVVAVRLVLGLATVTTLELAHGDLYPPGAPDGILNLQDVLLLQGLLMSPE